MNQARHLMALSRSAHGWDATRVSRQAGWANYQSESTRAATVHFSPDVAAPVASYLPRGYQKKYQIVVFIDAATNVRLLAMVYAVYRGAIRRKPIDATKDKKDGDKQTRDMRVSKLMGAPIHAALVARLRVVHLKPVSSCTFTVTSAKPVSVIDPVGSVLWEVPYLNSEEDGLQVFVSSFYHMYLL